MAKFYWKFFFKNAPRKIILIYHAVGNSPWAISVENFKAQIRFLKNNYKIVSINELLKNSERENKNVTEVALTFDDGYSCLHDFVLPILQSENISATVYINTSWIADEKNKRKDSRTDLGHYPEEKFLVWDEVKKLAENSWKLVRTA